MKQFKRILAMVLSLSMVLGLCPVMAAEPEENSMLLLSGADVSTTEELDIEDGEEPDPEPNILVYSQAEFEDALLSDVYEIDIMEGTHIVLEGDVETGKMIYVDAGASLTVPAEYTLTLTGADGLALEIPSLQAAEHYALPENIVTDAPVLMMFTEGTVQVDEDAELASDRMLVIGSTGRLELGDDVLVTVRNPIPFGADSGYFQECIGDDDSLVTLEDPDSGESVRWLCGSLDVVQSVLDAHPNWEIRQLTVGAVGEDNILTLVDEADKDSSTLFLGERSPKSFYLMCETRLVLDAGVQLTVDELALFRYWDTEHTDSILLEVRANASITVTGETFIRGNISYDPSADLDFRGADLTTRYPHLEADWLTEWDFDEEGALWGESENPQTEIWTTALDEPYLIFFAEYFYEDEWHYEPVVPEIDDVEMRDISDRAARGEPNDWAFVQLADLEWKREYTACWEAPDGNQVTMPIHVELPALGFYTENAIDCENYISALPYTPWNAYSGEDLTVWMGHVDQDLPVQDVKWIIHHNEEQGTDGYIRVGDRDEETGLYPVTIDADAMESNTHFDIQVRYHIDSEWVEESWLHVYGQDMSIWLDEKEMSLDEEGNLCQLPYSADLGANHLALAKDETRTGMLYFVFYDDLTERWVCDPYGPEWFRDDMGLVSIEYQNENEPYPLAITGTQYGDGSLLWKNGCEDENGDWVPNDEEWDDCGILNLEVGGIPVYVSSVEELIARAANGIKELLVVNADMTLTQDLETDDTICLGVNADQDYAYQLTLGENVYLHTTGGLELVVETKAEFEYALSSSVTSEEDKFLYVRGAFTLDELEVPQGTSVLVMKGADLRVAAGSKVTFLNGSMGFAHTKLQGEEAVPLHAKCSVFADAIYYKSDEEGNWTEDFRVLYENEAALATDLAEKAANGWQVGNLIFSAAAESNAPGEVTLSCDLSDIYMENLMIQDGSQLVLKSGAAIRAGWLEIAQVWEDHDTYADVLLVLEDGASLMTDEGYIQGSGQWSGKAAVRLGQLEFEGPWPHLAAKWIYRDAEGEPWQFAGDYEHHTYSAPDGEHNLAFFTAIWNEAVQDYDYAPITDADAPVIWSPDGGYQAQVTVLEANSNYRQVEMHEFGTYVAVYSDGETFSGSMPLTNGLPELGFFRYPERSFENYLGADGAWFLYGENGDWSNEFYIDLAGDASFEIVNWWTDEGQDWYHIEDMGNQMWKVVLHENFTNDPSMRDTVRFGFTMHAKDDSWTERDQEITAIAHHVSNVVSYVTDAEGLVLAAQSGVGTIRLNNDITLSASDLPEEMNGILRVNAVLDFASHDTHLTLEDDVVLQLLQWPEWGEEQDDASRIDFGVASLNLIPYENDRPCLIYFAKGVSDHALGDYMSRLAADGGLEMVRVITDSFDVADAFTLTMDSSWPELNLQTVELCDNAKLVLKTGAVLRVDNLYAHDSAIDYEQMTEYQRQEASELLVEVRSGATLQVRNELNVDGHLNWAPDAKVQFDCEIRAAGYWPRLEHTWLEGTENGLVEHDPAQNGEVYDYRDWNDCNTSREENRIFFIRYFDGKKWTQTPVPPVFAIDGMPVEDFVEEIFDEAEEYQTNKAYFIRYSLEEWNRTYTATATGAGYTLSTHFRTGLGDVGFYSQPEVSEDYAVNELALSPVEDNVFYMGFDINADQTHYAEDVILHNFTMEADDDLITMEKLDSGMYKLTIPAVKARELGHNGLQADFTVIMTHGNYDQEDNLESWNHDYSIGISTHNTVVFSESIHLTDSAKVEDSLLNALKTEVALEAGSSVTGSLYQVEYWENETDPGWHVQPFAAEWFVSGSDNGHFAAAQEDGQKTTITADAAGLYQIYRAQAEPDGEDSWRPGDGPDWGALPLDIVITGEDTGEPYLTVGWLQEHWNWDEAAQQHMVTFTEDRLNGHHEGITVTPGQIHNLIFYLHSYDAQTGRWVSEPVSVTVKTGSSEHITLSSLFGQAVNGQSNGDKFVALNAGEAQWGDAVTLVGTSAADPAISAEMTILTTLPGHGFYSKPEMTTDNYLPEYELDPLNRDYVFYFGCINEGESLTINDYDTQILTVEPVENVPNLYKITVAETLAQLSPEEKLWVNLYWTTDGGNDVDGTYSYTGETGIRCYMPAAVEIRTEEQLKSAAASGVAKIRLANDITLNDLVIVYDKELNLNGHNVILSENGALAVNQMPLTGHETDAEEHPEMELVMEQIDSIGAVLYDDGKICWNASLQQMREDVCYRMEMDNSAPQQLFMDDTDTRQTLVIDQNWPQLDLSVLTLNPGWSLEVTDDAQVSIDRFTACTADPESYDPNEDTTVRVQVSGDAYLNIHGQAQVWGHINWTSGGHIDLPEDLQHWGEMPELVFYWLDCPEEGWRVNEGERNTGFGSTPLEVHRAVFFVKVWEDGRWIEHPVYAYDGMNRASIFRSIYDYEEEVRFADPDDPTNEYFVVLDCGYAGWDEERTIAADWNGTYVEMGAYFGYGDNGFFREPEASPETYINHYTMTREGENSFYFILDSDHDQIEGVYNLCFDDDGNEIADASLPGWDKVKVEPTADPNVWKITVNEDTNRLEEFHFELYFKSYPLDDQGNILVDEETGEKIVHGRHHMGITVDAAEIGETLALLRINNEEYHVTEDGVLRYTDTGVKLQESLAAFFEGTVDYDLEHNTLLLRNAHLNKLELGYSWDDATFLPGEDLRIQLEGTSTISNTEDHAMILHDGIKAIFQGEGTLQVTVNNGDDPNNEEDNGTFDAVVVNQSELVLSEGVTVNIEADGIGYPYHNPADGEPEDPSNWNEADGYFYENGEKAPCHIRALNSHEGGAALCVQNGATLTATVPKTGRYDGIAGFDSVVVRDEGSSLATRSIRFYGESCYLDVYDGGSATVTGVEERNAGIDEQNQAYVNYDIGAIFMDNGYIKIYNGGSLNVTTDVFSYPDLESTNYHVTGITVSHGGFLMGGSDTAVTIDLSASQGWTDGLHVGSGEIRVNDGSLDVTITSGIAVAVGEQPHEGNPNPVTILNHNGGTVKIRTGEQEEDASAYQISYGSTANFNGTSVNDIRAFRALSNLGTVNFREATEFNAEATEWAYEYGLVVNEPAWNEYGRSSALNIYGGTLNLNNRSGLTGRQDDEGNAITVSSVLNNCNDFIMTGGTVNIKACEAVFTGIDCCGVNLISGGTINIGSAEGDRPLAGINVWYDESLPNSYLRLTGGTIHAHGNRRGAILQAGTYLQGGSFNATAYVDDGVGAIAWVGEAAYSVTVVGGSHTFTAPVTQQGIGLQSMMVPVLISGGSVTANAGNAVISIYEKEGDHQNDPTFYNMFTLYEGIHAVSKTNNRELQFIEHKSLDAYEEGAYTYYVAWLDDDNQDKSEEDGTLPALTANSVVFSAAAGEQAPEEPDPVPETVVLSTLEVTSSRMTVGAPVSLRASVTVEQGGTITFTLPDALRLVEDSVAVNNVQVDYEKDGTAFTLTVEGAAVITFQVIPEKEGIFAIDGLVVENGTGKTSSCGSLLSVSGFRMSAPTYTSIRNIQVSGAAQRGQPIELHIRYKNANGQDLTKIFSGTVSALGTFVIDVTLPVTNTSEAQTFTIDAFLYGDLLVGSTTVVYNRTLCKIRYLDITNRIHGNSADEVLDVNNCIGFTTGTGVPDRSFYTYWPELKNFDFKATFDESGDWTIDWVQVDVTYRNGGSDSFRLEKTEESNVWKICDAVVRNAPVDFSVIYSCSAEGSDPIIIAPGLIPIMPIMDPSGTVTVDGVPTAGAVVTIYFGGDGETPDETDLLTGEAYNTTDLQQVNPQITDESGRFHWDVPEGWWKVVAVTEDGKRAESEWLKVQPIHTDLILELTPSAAVKTGTVFEQSAAMEIPVIVHTSTRNDPKQVVIAAIYDANGKLIAMDMQAVSGIDEVILTVDNSKGEAAEIRTFLVSDFSGFMPVCPSKSYLKN